jgi:hypothetical protein
MTGEQGLIKGVMAEGMGHLQALQDDIHHL